MKWLTAHDVVTGEEYIAVDTRGEALLRDPLTNKGTAFTEGERADLGLDGSGIVAEVRRLLRHRHGTPIAR